MLLDGSPVRERHDDTRSTCDLSDSLVSVYQGVRDYSHLSKEANPKAKKCVENFIASKRERKLNIA